jgi:hypothetical protein
MKKTEHSWVDAWPTTEGDFKWLLGTELGDRLMIKILGAEAPAIACRCHRRVIVLNSSFEPVRLLYQSTDARSLLTAGSEFNANSFLSTAGIGRGKR